MSSISNRSRSALLSQATVLRRVYLDNAEDLHGLERTEADPVDRAVDSKVEDLLERLTAAERRHLEEIDAALERIDQGRFGICESCGEEIGGPRLEAVPETRVCIECSRDDETRLES